MYYRIVVQSDMEVDPPIFVYNKPVRALKFLTRIRQVSL